MTTQFIYDPENEYERLVIVMESLAAGHYTQAGFIVLPYPLPQHPKTVFLPKLPRFPYSSFKKQLADFDKTNSATSFKDDPLVSPIVKAIKKTGFKPETPDLSKLKTIESEWKTLENRLEDYLVETFPRFRGFNIDYEVRWTHYGSLLSYRFGVTKRKRIALKAYVRDDMGLTQIAEGFFSSLFGLKLRQDYGFSWSQHEAITDFIFLETKLYRLFPDYCPTFKKPKPGKDLERLIKESRFYLNKLGFGTDPAIEEKNQRVWINGRPPKVPFTNTEEKILVKLLQTPDEPVSYFELGDLLWEKDPDSFSLWALSRLIYKIRNKLRLNGLSEKLVKNQRGQGYLLRD